MEGDRNGRLGEGWVTDLMPKKGKKGRQEQLMKAGRKLMDPDARRRHKGRETSIQQFSARLGALYSC